MGKAGSDDTVKVTKLNRPPREPAHIYPSQHAAKRQQQRVLQHVDNTDSYAMFNLLTGPRLLDRVEALLPNHRERLFPPTETLSMFLAQALSTDGSCRQVVNDAAVKNKKRGQIYFREK